ncbi:hypothetical protein AX14_004210 [Amanita brunnescens Koide BX004]|nr:hypothetical protein AX14_004210 [Amanita brunnescens Koide BX004]
MNTEFPPKVHVQLRDMHKPEKNCPELTQETANAIDDASLNELFVSTQMNNLDLCVEFALQFILNYDLEINWTLVAFRIFSRFPHYWQDRNVSPFYKNSRCASTICSIR